MPPAPSCFRIEFRRRHLVFGILLALAVLGPICTTYVSTLRRAEARVGELRSLTAAQSDRLRTIDAQAGRLDRELRGLQKQDDQIRKLIGDRGRPRPAASPDPRRDDRQSQRPNDAFTAVAQRIERLRADSARVGNDANRLRRVTLRVLNMHRLADLARARVLAAIPSLNPAGSAVAIRSPYGWRASPWPEFHEGVDLDVDYGDPVRATAAGTVAFAGYDGGYGYKVDIDHANGYHTWYCHLSRIDVAAGEYVRKAEHIALVGSSGASTGPHLHYQIVLDGKAIDPTPYLRGVPDRVLASLK